MGGGEEQEMRVTCDRRATDYCCTTRCVALFAMINAFAEVHVTCFFADAPVSGEARRCAQLPWSAENAVYVVDSHSKAPRVVAGSLLVTGTAGREGDDDDYD